MHNSLNMKYLFIFLFIFNIKGIFAQNTPQNTGNKRPPMPDTTEFNTNILDKKVYVGIIFNSTWASIDFFNNQPETYFFKPSLGGGVAYQNYFTKKRNIGFETGLILQQRGAGIRKTDDLSKDNIDSSNRWRFRVYNLEVPLKIIYRSKFLGKGQGVKFSAAAGIAAAYTLYASRVYISAEDGFHDYTDETSNFSRLGVLAHASAGIDIAAGESAVLQLQLLYQLGINNAYSGSGAYSNFSGRHSLFGLRLGFLL